jgi:uncharacterized membrane protein YbhN (UPF0104 family)
MFCPECATRNLRKAKFCRACGTNLEVVSLALAADAGSLIKSEGTANNTGIDSLAKRQAGMRNVVQGSILLIVSGLLALIGFLISTEPSSWLPIWSVFFGWMACWGAVTLAIGSSKLIESKLTLPKDTAANQFGALPPANPTASLSPFSITERTTRHLEERK